MSKVARPALMAALRFVKDNGMGFLVYFFKMMLLSIPVGLLLRFMATILGLHTFDWDVSHLVSDSTFSLLKEMSEPTFFSVLSLGILVSIGFALLMAPLMVSIHRSILLGEKFDDSLFSRILAPREFSMVGGLMLVGGVKILGQLMLLSWWSMASFSLGILPSILIFVLFIYIALSLYYSLPALSIDKSLHIQKTWALSGERMWAIIKLVALFYLFLLLFIIGGVLVMGVLLLASYGSSLWVPVLVSVAVLFVLFVMVVIPVAMTYLYKEFEENPEVAEKHKNVLNIKAPD